MTCFKRVVYVTKSKVVTKARNKIRILSKSFVVVAALMFSVPAYANDGEKKSDVQIVYPSPNSFGAKGTFTVRHNLDGNTVFDLEEFLALQDLGGDSVNDLEIDGIQYSAERPSQTAVFLFRRGERHFTRNKWDKAERAFKASLRANDGGLETYSYLYLANISKLKGDTEQAQAYTARYYGIGLY